MSRRKQSNPRQIKRPLEDGLEEEEEECVSDGNELVAKDEFSMEENFTADFETENLTCEDMEYFCNKGEENSSREMGDTDMEGQNEKTRHPPLESEEWDGPRELDLLNKDGERRIHSRQQLPVGTTWGPFDGKIEMSTETTGLAGRGARHAGKREAREKTERERERERESLQASHPRTHRPQFNQLLNILLLLTFSFTPLYKLLKAERNCNHFIITYILPHSVNWLCKYI
uniref:Zinc finger protein ZFPM1/2 PR domain-containing protein n=1 Tax=Astyanax mexicanus TaxID=7994 RepID=A0A8B9HBV9_ASTMX